MLIDATAILLNLLNIALFGLLAAVALLSLLWPLTAHYLQHLSPFTQQRVLWLFVTTPWVASSICVCVFLASLNQNVDFLWLDQLAHWHHPYVFQLDSWHSVTLVLFILGLAYLLTKKGLDAARHLNTLKSITHLSQKKTGHERTRRDIIVLESQTPTAFAAGLVNSKCYITTGLIEQVSKTELDIIIAHERAHIRHRDVQKKLLFTLFASLYPKPVARRLNRLFSVAMEQLADAHVCQSHCAFDIAETLLKAARAQQVSTRTNSLLVNYVSADDVDIRVRALIAPQTFRSLPWAYCLLLMVLITLLSSVAVDALHHLIEALFSH